MTPPTDPTSDLARELRQRVGEEFRAAAEEGEADARKIALRSRTLGHVAYELMTRGDHVAVHAGEAIFTGPIVHARGDLAIVEMGPSNIVYVNLAGPITLRTTSGRTSGRTWDRTGATSFLAALRELDMHGATVDVHAPGPLGQVTGKVEAVTPDHLMLITKDATFYIPIAEIVAVVSERGDEPVRSRSALSG